ncbi:MAG: aminotransferase class III-fold pyridoxal phosphate-dependent enzyme [Chitinophagales bacterium]|nr:aminotransferase class III-fold pyridoxal phosphate-dependent enzyme [Chitinophagales bacterium]
MISQDIHRVQKIAREAYGIIAEAKPLSGYEDINFLLETQQGEKFIFKISTASSCLDFLQAQAEVMKLLSISNMKGHFPVHIPNLNDELITISSSGGKVQYIRVLSWIEGDFWVNWLDKDRKLYESLGAFLGEMDSILNGLYISAAERYLSWDICRASDAVEHLQNIHDPEKSRIAGYFLLQFHTEVFPKLNHLRKAIIHNDANDYNVLVSDDKVVGLIDFGDMVWSALINNLAIACTYAMLDTNDPIEKASWVIGAYHRVYPLQLQEIDLLYYLIASRLSISVTQSATQMQKKSNNAHHFLTDTQAWDLLQKLICTNPIKAADTFRKACDFAPLINENEDYVALLSDRKKHIGRNLSISYQQPLKIVKGALQYLYDDKGRTYIDCVNNVSHVGHCHPDIVRTMQHQIAVLNTNTRYLSDLMVSYAKELTQLLPEKLNVCYFVNSGSEANDLAIRMARQYTGRKDIVVLDHAYHGTSTLAIEMSPYKFDGQGGSGQKPYIHKALSPDLYRGCFQSDDQNAGEKYAAQILELLCQMTADDKPIAAFICETLLGVGGQIPLPNGYLKKVYEYVHQYGGLCIADEVQVGFGRVGSCFWGFELQEVEPDIVVLGKPIGNGHPLAAVVVTDEIADAFNNGMEYFNTFGGNPVSMATGSAVLKVLKNENLQAHALRTGNLLLSGLRQLQNKYPIIGDVRGHGLFIGVEMVGDRITKTPAVEELNVVVEAMKERGFLLSTDGPLHNVLKIKPPLTFSEQNAKDLVRHLGEVLDSI